MSLCSKPPTNNEPCSQEAQFNSTMYMHLTTKITHPVISQKCIGCLTSVKKKCLEYSVLLLKGHAETVNSVLADAKKIDLREEK